MLKLIEFDYVENKGLPSEWAIKKCTIGSVNLFVGKNAAGKSRILRALYSFASTACEQRVSIDTSKIVEWRLVFSEIESGDKIEFNLSIAKGEVISENLSVNDTRILVRDSLGAVEITVCTGVASKEQVNSTNLAVYELSFSYHFLEKFVDWATCFCYGLHDFTILQAIPNGEIQEENNILNILAQGNLTEPEYINAVMSDMIEVGYPVSHLGTRPSVLHGLKPCIAELYGSPECLFTRCADKTTDLEQLEMSKGMFRVLATLIKVNYLLLICARIPSCVTIDDLGEGLDPAYAKKLTALLFNKFATSESQLIVATNNEYVMNAVSLEHWSLIEKFPNGVRFKNRHNSQKEIEEFNFLGLNNFDYFRQSQD